jgi:hypothetical protein
MAGNLASLFFCFFLYVMNTEYVDSSSFASISGIIIFVVAKKRKAENQSPLTVAKKPKNETSSTPQTPASAGVTTTPLPARFVSVAFICRYNVTPAVYRL